MRKRILAALLGLLVAFGIIAVAATPAAAAYSECTTANSLCIFDGNNGGDPMLIWYTSGWQGTGCQNLSPAVNDKPTSAISWFVGHSVTFYAAAGCTSEVGRPSVTLPPSTTVQFGGQGCGGCLGLNNNVSSIYFS